MHAKIVQDTKVTGCYSIFAKTYVIISACREKQLYVQEVQTTSVQKGACGVCKRRTTKHMAEYRSTGRELRKSPKGLIVGLFLIALTAAGAFYAGNVLNNMVSLEPDDSDEAEISVPDMSEMSEESSRIEYGSVRISKDRIRRGPLMLVNDSFPTEDAEEGIVSVFEQKNEYLTVRDMEVRLLDETMDALNRMAEGFHTATGHADLLVRDGYITKDAQKRLYEADLQMTGGSSSALYAMPGCSEFESGYTFELSLFVNGAFEDFTDEGDYAWILQHCAEYGFVQRYPEGKSEYTHVTDRPWVFRYVGTPHAWYMYKNKLCLEEYTEMLEMHPFESEHALISDQLGREYEVYYVSVDPDDPEPDTVVPMPIDCQYSYTGNNKHGFYVTVNLETAT